jgi:uncharacterized protein YecT (DUF1311 family)
MTSLIFVAVAFLANAGASNPCGNGTTVDMQICWSKRNAAASTQLKATYAQALAKFESAGRSTAPLKSSQAAWLAARDKTCAFEYQLYSGGTIAPQLAVECYDRANRSRSGELTTLIKTTVRHAEEPVSRVSDVRLSRMNRLYVQHLTPPQRALLASSQHAWTEYRESWCAIARGSCQTQLTNERVAELEASWMGEPFWK